MYDDIMMMGKFDQHASSFLLEDWMSNPMIFSSSDILDEEDISCSTYVPEIPLDNDIIDKIQKHYLSPEENSTSECFELGGGGGEEDWGLDLDLDLPKTEALEGRIRERVEARNGFDLRLNLENIKLSDSSDSVIYDAASTSHYFKTPSISPRAFLDSPTFLSNPLVLQPSPTTGKFPFSLGKNSTFAAGEHDSVSFFDDFGSSSFESKPIDDSGPSFIPASTSRLLMGEYDTTIIPLTITANEDKISLDHNQQQQQQQQQQLQDEEQKSTTDLMMLQDEEQNTSGDHVGMMMHGASSSGEDFYNWRKYGQKHVKCSDYPRSYYKCTHPNCPVRKKVERSHEGLVTEIIYEKTHNHPEPINPNRNRLTTNINIGSSSHPTTDPHHQNGTGDSENSLQSSVDHGLPPNLSNTDHEEVNQQVVGQEDEHESKRRKMEASYTNEHMSGATRAIREPRVVIQATSVADILDDGYRWRKYGQKVVKGNPNPRSYYKCTSAGCPVRKHVERASDNLRSILTTYEAKHIHHVPAARNNNNNNNNNNNSNSSSINNHINNLTNQPVGFSTACPVQPHNQFLQRVDHQYHQIQNEMLRFNSRPVSHLGGTYGMNGRQLMAAGHPNGGFNYGMNQFSNNYMGMAGLGSSSNQPGNMASVLAMPNYLGQHNQMGGLIMPKGEPTSESPINNSIVNNNHNGPSSSSSSVYHQIMTRL
ncbi:probable WRKY transcription factor 33 isoform X2 [Impatiens glandulifera]|uniref:probable WRKY transcription factor 33 isoform X2 n=1 Tax=Impatiens glandulifera TaxID=253017 RepID=UPI001FB19BAC|nr:probable WRKY transcription factor 33 isoform X2 [Impatiens glandulifera]